MTFSRADERRATLRVRHLYLHIPYCTGKCHYCAFHSGLPPARPEVYVDTLLREIERRQLDLAPVETLYCGGGTPALLGVEGFKRLAAEGLTRLLPQGEWSVELHPAAVTPALLEALATLGVTRLSIGVQALDNEVLRRCNRRHTAQQALEAVALARRFIPDTGIDLIAGLPGVTPMGWEKTLGQVLELGLPHLSIYALSIDEGSAWHRQGMRAPDPDLVCDAVAVATERLAAAGLERYETSNFAREGYRCRHNLNTWTGGDYLGLGEGAVSRLGVVRRYGDGTEEVLAPLEDAMERALTELRLDTGFHPRALVQRYPLLEPYVDAWEEALATFRAHGFLDTKNAPTTRGYEVLDALERELLCV